MHNCVLMSKNIHIYAVTRIAKGDMDMNEIWNEVWKALVLIIFGMLLLRLAGRKSISQMTIPTTIAMISIGTIIVEPIVDQPI
ncbi:hypothetical protein AWJ19_24610 [Paenibacillus sp. DMB5]|nr:hypothetical protein AWJ19_24610 [Paenibacillus sp. DMB5]